MQYKGIDVSRYQGDIDWTSVKTKGKIDFAILKIGTIIKKEAKFEQNYKEAKANCLNVGGYFYSFATSVEEARREAYDCLDMIKGKRFEYPIWYDLEEAKTRKQGKKVVSAIASTFCSILEENGYYAGIYSNLSWLKNYYNKSVLDKYDVWIAQYNSKCTWDGKYGIWQYSSTGKVDGIKGNVDMDISYKDYPAIIKANGLNGFAKTTSQKATSQTTGTKAEKTASTTAPTKVSTQTPKQANKAISGQKKGKCVMLSNAKLYKSATATKEAKKISGKYWIYDGEAVNGRYRITNKEKYVGKKPTGLFVTGWVKL